MTIEYDQLKANDANFVALTPLSFLQPFAQMIRVSAIAHPRTRYSQTCFQTSCSEDVKILSNSAATANRPGNGTHVAP